MYPAVSKESPKAEDNDKDEISEKRNKHKRTIRQVCRDEVINNKNTPIDQVQFNEIAIPEELIKEINSCQNKIQRISHDRMKRMHI